MVDKIKRINPVQKNMDKFNKPKTHRDKKNDYSRKNKHKNIDKGVD